MKSVTKHPPHYIYGVDFSSAKDAGKKTWIAKGIVEGKTPLIEDCKNRFKVGRI